ncbi:MAG TPA: hypothetical protein GXZ47_07485 [Treponema sp.]|nr:hypothetical protein [Treponema sp.]
MKRLITTCIIFIISASAVLAAQTELPASSVDYEPIRKGDQFIHVELGISVPLFNISSNGLESTTNLDLGGSGRIGYARFLTSHISLGGSLGFSFNSTLGENMFLALPITFRTTYELVFNRIHVPISISTGGVFQTYRTRNYFGLILKPEVGGYYQYSPDWSFGATLSWDIMPQWYNDSSSNRVGNFLNAMLGLRYHF